MLSSPQLRYPIFVTRALRSGSRRSYNGKIEEPANTGSSGKASLRLF